MKRHLKYWTVVALLVGGIGCQHRDITDDPTPPSPDHYQGVQLSVSAAPLHMINVDNPQRQTKTTVDGLVTKFNAKDSIGMFAVFTEGENAGKLHPDFDNIKFTKQAGLVDLWRPVKSTFRPREKVKYFLYYPYSSKMKGCTSVDKADDVSSILSKWTALNLFSVDQSDTTKYQSQDLMTADNVVVNEDTDVFTAEFKHRMAVVEMSFRDQTGKYDANDELVAGWDPAVDGIQYHPDDIDNATYPIVLKVEGAADVTIKPLWLDMGRGRFLLPSSLMVNKKAQLFMKYIDGHGTKTHTSKQFDAAEGTMQVMYPELRQITVQAAVGNGKIGTDFRNVPAITNTFMVRPTLKHAIVLEVDMAAMSNAFHTNADGLNGNHWVNANALTTENTNWNMFLHWHTGFSNGTGADAVINFKQSNRVDGQWNSGQAQGLIPFGYGSNEKVRIRIKACEARGTAQLGYQVKSGGSYTTAYLFTLWLTDFDASKDSRDLPEVTYGKKMMDRNLGAAEARDRGLYYQWGFPKGHYIRDASNVFSTTAARSLIVAISRDPFAIQSETTSTVYDVSGESSSEANMSQANGMNRWGGNAGWTSGVASTTQPKSSLDPCPAGWRVPNATNYGIVFGQNAFYSTAAVNGNPYGFALMEVPSHNLLFPFAGRVIYASTNAGKVEEVNNVGYYWDAAAISSTTSHVWALTTVQVVNSSATRMFGHQVRCVEDK